MMEFIVYIRFFFYKHQLGLMFRDESHHTPLGANMINKNCVRLAGIDVQNELLNCNMSHQKHNIS